MAMSSAYTLVAITSATLAITSASQFHLQTVVTTSATMATTSAIIITGPSGITSATAYIILTITSVRY